MLITMSVEYLLYLILRKVIETKAQNCFSKFRYQDASVAVYITGLQLGLGLQCGCGDGEEPLVCIRPETISRTGDGHYDLQLHREKGGQCRVKYNAEY